MKIKLPFLFIAGLLTFTCSANPIKGKVVCREYEDYILTHELTPFGPVPTAFDPNGVYPYVSYAETSNRPLLKKYKFVL